MSISSISNILSELQAKMPVLSTKKALVILNMQNDSFDQRNQVVLCEQQEFRRTLSDLIPHFRCIGDIVWVKTELDMTPLSPPTKQCKMDSGVEQPQPQPQSRRSSPVSEIPVSNPINDDTITHYYPSSSKREEMTKLTSEARQISRKQEVDAWDQDKDPEEYLKKPRKGIAGDSIFIAGTRGVDLTPDMLVHMDPKNDLVLVKHHYSAFDGTSLLMSLRMKMITHIYLAGCLSNVSVHSTAADAVKHGFEVTVVEDCLGYRSEKNHLEAMRHMADLLGVSGSDSKELIESVQLSVERPGSVDTPKSSNMSIQDLIQRQDLPDQRTSISRSPSMSTTLVSPTQEDFRRSSVMALMDSAEVTQMEGIEGVKASTQAKSVVLGPGDKVGEGDSSILRDALSPALADSAFRKVFQEVDWQVMKHRNGEVPRRVAVQGATGYRGAVPLYRHPADESPPFYEFSPTVRRIRDELQILLKQPFNHCLIQLYRNGQDNISEHSDKTLDIVRGSSIINLSLGAQRTMTLRSKKEANQANEPPAQRNIQRTVMPHNSCFVLGWRTNQRWLHGVRPDKRLMTEKTPEELAYGGQRISLTFRNIGTFTNRARTKIWGQGAKSKIEATAGDIITTNNPEMEAMIHAFGMENHQTDFDWDAYYGAGFDVLNLVITGTPTTTSMLLCADEIANLRVKMGVMHRSIDCRFVKAKPKSPTQSIDGDGATIVRPSATKRSIFALSGDENPTFRDCDANLTEAFGDIAILVYINRFFPGEPNPNVTAREEHRVAGSTFERLTSSNELLFLWQELRGIPFTGSTAASHRIRRFITNDSITTDPASSEGLDLSAIFEAEMDVWEEIAGEGTYISGEIFHVTDCAIWPVLNEIVRRWEGWSERRYPSLASYWRRVGAMPATRKAMLEKGE